MINIIRKVSLFLVILLLLGCPGPNQIPGDGDGSNEHVDRFYINYGEEATLNRQVFLKSDIENAVEMRFSNAPFTDASVDTAVRTAASKGGRGFIIPGENFTTEPELVDTLVKVDLDLVPIGMQLPAEYFVAENDGSLSFDSKFSNSSIVNSGTIISTELFFEAVEFTAEQRDFIDLYGLDLGIQEPNEAADDEEPASEPSDWMPYAETYENWILPSMRGDAFIFAEYKLADGEVWQTWNNIFLMVEDEQDVDFMLNQIGRMDETEQDAEVTDTAKEENSGYVCSVETYSAAPGFDKMMLLDPQTDVIYPGNILDGESIDDGSYAVITARRLPPTLTLSNISGLSGKPSARADYTGNDYRLSNFENSRQELLNKVTDDSRNAASSNWETYTFHSSDEFQLAVGCDGSYSSVTWDADFEFSNTEIKTRAMFRYQQKYYSITCDYPTTPSGFWPVGTTWDELAITDGMSPMYVSTVNYGRMLMITVSSKYEEKHIMAALEAGYDPVGSNEVNLDTEVNINNVLAESTVKGYVIGGDSASAAGGTVFSDLESLQTWIQDYTTEGATFRPNTAAAPLSYNLRYVRNGFPIGKVVLQTEYNIRNCKLVTSTFRVSNTNVYCVAHDDHGDGEPEEIYGWTRASAVVYMKDAPTTPIPYTAQPLMEKGRADHTSLVSINPPSGSIFTHSADAYASAQTTDGVSTTNIDLGATSEQVFRFDDLPLVDVDSSGDFMNEIDMERSYILLEGEMYEADESASDDDVVGVGDRAEIGTGVKSMTIPLDEAFGYKYIHWGGQGGKGNPTGVIAVFYITPE